MTTLSNVKYQNLNNNNNNDENSVNNINIEKLLFDSLQPPTTKLRSLINNDDWCNLYEEYLKEHFAWENFGFYYSVVFYHHSKSNSSDLSNLAHNIYRFYLSDDAIFRINVDTEVAEQIFQTLDNPRDDLFDELQEKAFRELATSTLNEFVDYLKEPKENFKKEKIKASKVKQYPMNRNPSNYHFHILAELKDYEKKSDKHCGTQGFFSAFSNATPRTSENSQIELL